MTVQLRAMERTDLRFVHGLFNDRAVMSYWFEEPFDALAEMEDIYERHVHDERERRFIIESSGVPVGLVELVEINFIHRKCEFQIIVAPSAQGKGYAGIATRKALDYAFRILNLHKVYLFVDVANERAAHVYEKLGFVEEGLLREEYFSNGSYRDARLMRLFQRDFLASSPPE
ncbi:Diamine N-acetyltransferase OS=Tsukamurella paurometabola (strain ATCC 8368 / DSM / CCUG 35730/ CIP 100753 / JCM 10117 / KCTC 9821 / NBRC 16120 / NCIMB 702349 / NCTC 13040) OX=521096 GN=Tpau_1458 PE=4 SV=1 [Tsukamurella paurometabola]|uniref:Diamine N-acetyltransferase n=1 Tax=Tsukamurella paurometabola (strain ATCC 8368 / DSM 20162 / CCUG 35730 / CIP 100753 / JCM 10117 / KCTC 9821 / NBRC 16120 / NCIMB 702349 / NCTC 13040) TaxID=521096 RepID=D5UXJ3_TSUPD|nr:spermidine N1-acetyltransferase [Tsukamurella paurometabola]ADG78085.1 Diamine N-acetyltransferase [Tsukamurella paurometabola DSM 20162]SUP30110.1 Spermidine N(1)-acetyltransferase [Tsukamurella paurometabola]